MPLSGGRRDRPAHHPDLTAANLTGVKPMTIDRQKQLLQEIVSEYDLQTVIDALLLQHPLEAIEDALRGPASN